MKKLAIILALVLFAAAAQAYPRGEGPFSQPGDAAAWCANANAARCPPPPPPPPPKPKSLIDLLMDLLLV